MAGAILLQDWTTLQGGAAKIALQSERGWVDLAPFKDVAIWAEIADASNANLYIESSPTKDAQFFQAFNQEGPYTTPGVYARSYTMENAAHPLTRFVRWRVGGAAAWNITFRIWLSPNLSSTATPGPRAMRTFLAQDWTTIAGGGGRIQAQPTNTYLDLAGYKDVSVIREVSFSGGTTLASIEYQTSPSDGDRTLFATMATATASVGTVNTALPYATATLPLARFFRWRLVGNGAHWEVTFRLWVTAKESGPMPTRDILRLATAV